MCGGLGPRRSKRSRQRRAEQSPAGAEAAAPQERSPRARRRHFLLRGRRGSRPRGADRLVLRRGAAVRSQLQPGDGGGGGGGGGGQQQDEISRRQKEILVATWNLIRERTEGTSSYLDEQQLHDNSQMLADLQRTLAEQARTLASRARARQLTGVDERIQQFVQALEQAATAMGPAAERLADIELDNAVPPEQEALQHLLRAESVFTDIQVAFQQGGGGGGGIAGRDLSELFELEMDLEKNQYETEAAGRVRLARAAGRRSDREAAGARAPPGGAREAGESPQRVDGAGAVAAGVVAPRDRGAQAPTRADAAAARASAAATTAAGGPAGPAGNRASKVNSGQAGSRAASSRPAGQGQGSQTDQAIAQLNQALENMKRASSAGPEHGPRTGAARDRAGAARSCSRRSSSSRRSARKPSARRTPISRSARSSSTRSSARRAGAPRGAARQRRQSGQAQRSPQRRAADDKAQEFAERKEDLQKSSRRSRRHRAGRNSSAIKTPGASQELREALADLQAKQTSARFGYGAEASSRLRRASRRDGIGDTSALRDLQRNTEEAHALANQEAVAGEQLNADPNAELVAELQSLRRQLAELTQQQQQQLQQQSCSAGKRASRAKSSRASKASKVQGQQGGRSARRRAKRRPTGRRQLPRWRVRAAQRAVRRSGRLVRPAARRRVGSAQSGGLAEPGDDRPSARSAHECVARAPDARQSAA